MEAFQGLLVLLRGKGRGFDFAASVWFLVRTPRTANTSFEKREPEPSTAIAGECAKGSGAIRNADHSTSVSGARANRWSR